MDADRLADTLAEALAELGQTRRLLNQTATLLAAAWQLAALEGHGWGPALPEQGLPVSELPQRLGPAITARLTTLQAPAAPATPAADGPLPVEA